MLSLNKIRFRITAATLTIIIAIITMATIFGSYQINAIIENAERRELESIYRELQGELKNSEKLAIALAYAVALQPSTGRLFASRDRDSLLQEYLPVFQKMKEKFAVRQFQFHIAPATSFLRLHKLEKYNDDLSSFRHTVVLVNSEGSAVSGLEVGVAGLGIRGVVPVFDQGVQAGSLEFGLSFGKPFLVNFKKRHSSGDIELAFYLMKGNKLENFARTYEGENFLDQVTLQNAFKMTEHSEENKLKQTIQRKRIQDKERALLTGVVSDFSGKPIGIMEVSMNRDYYLSRLDQFGLILFLTGAVAILAGVLVSLFIGRGIARPIEQAVEHVKDIAEGEGDLTKRLSETAKGEVGELAFWINKFIQKIHIIVKEITFDTNMVLSSARELTGESARLSSQVVQMSDRAASIASAAVQMDQSFHSITDSIESMQKSLDGVFNQSTSASDIASKGDSKADHTFKLMQNLEKAAQGIDSVTEVIISIAGQTNLLALNASIEAAGAGDLGKGFAVVASEVKVLAEKASHSSDDIKNRVAGIQQSSANAVQAIVEITTIIKDVSHINAGIASSMSNLRERVSDITNGVRESSQASKETAQNIEEISRATQEGKESADQLDQLSTQLKTLADNLDRIVKQFKI